MENKFLKGFFTVIMTIVIIVALFLTWMTLSIKKYGYPNMLGYAIMSVENDEMAPTFVKGDIIVSKVTDNKIYKENDVITFLEETEEDTLIYKTRRVESIINLNDEDVYVTKGDNNIAVDEFQVNPNKIVAQYEGLKISFLGTVLSYLRTKMGFFICIIIPLLLFFIYQLYKFIMLVIEYSHDEEEEEEKEEVKKPKKTKTKKTSKKKTKEE